MNWALLYNHTSAAVQLDFIVNGRRRDQEAQLAMAKSRR
jgi:hypothetical protein